MTNNEQRRSNPQNKPNGSRNSNRSTASGRTSGRNTASSGRTSDRSSSAAGRNPNRSTTNRSAASGANANRSTAARRRRRPRRKLARLLRSGPVRAVLILIAAVILILLAVNIYKGFLCKGSYTIEAGETYALSDFLKKENPDAYFTEKSDTVDTSVPGTYTLRIKNGIFTHKCKLKVVDTVAPQGTAHDQQVVLGKECAAEDFVTDIVDVTPVTVTFAKQPDFSQEGSQNVELVLQDTSKNKTTLTAALNIVKDTQAPVITGVRDLTHSIGSGISYKTGVTVTDDLDPDVELEVDASAVDLNTEGTYDVVYSAMDDSGNSTSVTVKVTVITSTHTEEEVLELANNVLSEIIDDSMSDYDKASAIYDWVRGHITYSNSSSEAWTDAAYEGLVLGRGDCGAFTNASRALLTAAGIKNMTISKIPSDTTHAWNLVDVGDGWYHFDTTPRASHNERFFMWTDAQLMEYSNAYGLTHNYDKSQYPAIN